MGAIFQDFAKKVALDHFGHNGHLLGYTPLFVAERITQRLREMHIALDTSQFVKGHEFIGSSILIAADAKGHFGISWIDFAKTYQVEPGQINHRDPWIMGNHEDGIMFGLENLIEAWHCVV